LAVALDNLLQFSAGALFVLGSGFHDGDLRLGYLIISFIFVLFHNMLFLQVKGGGWRLKLGIRSKPGSQLQGNNERVPGVAFSPVHAQLQLIAKRKLHQEAVYDIFAPDRRWFPTLQSRKPATAQD
jgi:hypothetical protein